MYLDILFSNETILFMVIVMYIVLNLLISYHTYISNIIINYGKLLTIEISEYNAFNSLKHKK